MIAFMNPGGIRADLLENEAGEVTYGAAFSVQPFNNLVASLDLAGAQIKALANNFNADGGDSFSTFRAGTNRINGGLDIDALRAYLLAHDPVEVTPTDRISSVD